MIVMPGFVDTHDHMWSALGRNFQGDTACLNSVVRRTSRSVSKR
jgi:cytosine/adenosine deaminase-related metal-dependent hydrolase